MKQKETALCYMFTNDNLPLIADVELREHADKTLKRLKEIDPRVKQFKIWLTTFEAI